MSEKEICMAINLLNKEGVTGQPVSVTLIACKDTEPYAYRIRYRSMSTCESIVCIV